MSPLLLFVFVLASQVIGGFNTKLPPPNYGSTITILSIDGGGIKGILPTVVLDYLEKAIKNESKDENATLAHYFDVIAGTSTGGLITGMLTAPHPNDTSRPALSPPEILEFYFKYGPSIFNQTSFWTKIWTKLSGRAKYDGEFLHAKAREILQDIRLNDTLTKVIIPTFDIKKVHPIIFSSYRVNKFPTLNAKLSDIILGTSAAPTQLPPYNFTNGDDVFNLVDGALVAASPALLAVSEVVQQLENVPTKIILLSLGCGENGQALRVDAEKAKSFNTAFDWPPVLIQGLAGAAGDINEFHLKSLFSSPQYSDSYYLRIEEYNLDPSIVPDNATEENMEKIKKAGEDLLKEPVKVIDVTSFVPQEKPSEGTNAEALDRLAKILYKERQLRLKMKSLEEMKSMKKMGRPFIEIIEAAAM